MPPRQVIFTLALAVTTAVWLVTLIRARPAELPSGGDFYQLWLGARALVIGTSPYGESVAHEMREAYDQWGQHGLPYPIPALLPIAPLTILSVGSASAIWVGLCLIAIAAFIVTRPNWPMIAVASLLYIPLIRTVNLQQPTLMWVALAALLVVASERRWSILVGLLLALLPAKPQTGIMFALVGGIWALRCDRRALAWGIGWTVLLWGGPFLFDPGWMEPWLAVVQRYQGLYPHFSLLPLGLFLVALSYRLPWWAVAAVAQVVLFPIRDIYTVLPLLIAWIAVGGPATVAGVILGWAVLFVPGLDFLGHVWLGFLIPLGIAIGWHSFIVSTRTDKWMAWGRRRTHPPS
ncbi:MAG: hypothetical protein CYG59_26565 [Chloroflexi bacterium]|nr:MAG: hypothetical protein CYG59_26565 [Chloroflexota bacterium]